MYVTTRSRILNRLKKNESRSWLGFHGTVPDSPEVDQIYIHIAKLIYIVVWLP